MLRLKKRLGAILLCLVLAVGVLPVSALAAFTDVPANAWYANDVASVQRYGIINGTGNGKFSPKGTLTLAQAITMVARTYAYINYETIPTGADSTWYAPYLRYAAENGLCAMGEFGTNYNGECSRFTMAKLFERVVPEETDYALNFVMSLPDVEYNTYTFPVFHLYQLGVLTGSDKYGTFNPDQSITRAETAAILYRVLEPSVRKSFELEEIVDYGAIYEEAIEDANEYFFFSGNATAEYIATLASEGYDLGGLYFWREDLDGNGIDEIFFEFSSMPGKYYALYTISDFQIEFLAVGHLTEEYEEYYTICGDGRLARWCTGTDYYAMELYRLSNGTILELTDSFVCEYDWNGNESCWYSSNTSVEFYDFNTHAGYSPISSAYFHNIYDSYQ